MTGFESASEYGRRRRATLYKRIQHSTRKRDRIGEKQETSFLKIQLRDAGCYKYSFGGRIEGWIKSKYLGIKYTPVNFDPPPAIATTPQVISTALYERRNVTQHRSYGRNAQSRTFHGPLILFYIVGSHEISVIPVMIERRRKSLLLRPSHYTFPELTARQNDLSFGISFFPAFAVSPI